MKPRIERLLTVLAFVAVLAMAASDPFWYDHWFQVLIVVLLLICAATVGFLAGVAHGIKIGEQEWKL